MNFLIRKSDNVIIDKLENENFYFSNSGNFVLDTKIYANVNNDTHYIVNISNFSYIFFPNTLKYDNGIISIYNKEEYDLLYSELLNLKKNEQKKRLADIRYNKEISGVTFNNKLILSDRDNRNLFSQIYILMKDGLLLNTEWKLSESDWILLTINEVEQIIKLLAIHVDSCFKEEKLHQENIDKFITIDELESYQI